MKKLLKDLLRIVLVSLVVSIFWTIVAVLILILGEVTGVWSVNPAAADDGKKAPTRTAQYRGTSQHYDVTITDRGQYPDPEFKRLVEMGACRYFLGQERCVSIVGIGHPHHDGFWEWIEVRQCVRVDQNILGCRAFRPVQEKCYIFEIEPGREAKIKRRCTKDEEVDLIELTVQLGDACEEILNKNKEASP